MYIIHSISEKKTLSTFHYNINVYKTIKEIREVPIYKNSCHEL